MWLISFIDQIRSISWCSLGVATGLVLNDFKEAEDEEDQKQGVFVLSLINRENC